MTQRQGSAAPPEGKDILLKQYEQTWQQSRHIETMRMQVLMLYFAFLGVSVLATANLLGRNQPDGANLLIWLTVIDAVLLLVTGFTALTILRMKLTLGHYGQEECDFVQRLMRHLPDVEDRHLAQNLCPITRPRDRFSRALSIETTAERLVLGLFVLFGLLWIGLLLDKLWPQLAAVPTDIIIAVSIWFIPVVVYLLGSACTSLLWHVSRDFREMHGPACRLDVQETPSRRHDRPKPVCECVPDHASSPGSDR